MTIIELKNYFELFNPPESTFNFNENTLNERKSDIRIIKICKKDHRDSYNEELKLLKILKATNNELYYVFEVPFHEDAVVVYVVDVEKNEVLYKFFVPMA